MVGGVAGALVAAAHVQVNVGSFFHREIVHKEAKVPYPRKSMPSPVHHMEQ
ncbi:hypothetical protein QQ045_024216 [Rhodiola kirilowii]